MGNIKQITTAQEQTWVEWDDKIGNKLILNNGILHVSERLKDSDPWALTTV